MALFDLHHPVSNTFGARVDALRASFAHWRRRRAVYTSTRDELLTLSDRDLTDLGISRTDIPKIAEDAARKV